MSSVVETIQSWNQRSLTERTRNRMAELTGYDTLATKDKLRSAYEHDMQQPPIYREIPRVDMGDAILEGKDSDTCSCRIVELTSLGEPVFDCLEARPGECMYRVASEPDLKCLYCLERFEGDKVRKACIREEAQEYARLKMYEDRIEAMDSGRETDGLVIQTPY